jgi:pimeloyl-ACP methyl ester carboxylesterase
MTVEPIVILGGFLSAAWVYYDLRATLIKLTGRPVSIVNTHGPEWLGTVIRPGWVGLLRKLDRAVQAAARQSSTGKVTLIGHSAGGVLARLYLSDRPFLGYAYRGLDRVSQLITLGSPHHNRGGLTHGGRLSHWIEHHYPGAYFAPRVTYISVAGKSHRGDRDGTRAERFAYDVYRDMCGSGDTWGDGLIPIESAVLHGSQSIVLDGVSHYAIFDECWYGSEAIVPRWWQPSHEQQTLATAAHPIESAAPQCIGAH